MAGLFLNRLDYGSHPWLERLRGLRVSAHFFIRRDGAVIQFVSTEDRAWHAGVSRYAAGNAATTFPSASSWRAPTPSPADAQYQALRQLARAARALPAPPPGPRTHRPGRKTDPGPAFNWTRFGRESGFARRQLPPA